MGNFAERGGGLAAGRGTEGLGVLGEIGGMRELLVAKHGERCEAIMEGVRQELRLLAACSASIDGSLDAAHEQFYRVLDAAANIEQDSRMPAEEQQLVADAEATAAVCLRTEGEPAATDYMQWMLETQRSYRQECTLKEQLIEQLISYDDGALVTQVKAAWAAQPFVSARSDLDPDGSVSVSARVLYALQESERVEAQATAGASPRAC